MCTTARIWRRRGRRAGANILAARAAKTNMSAKTGLGVFPAQRPKTHRGCRTAMRARFEQGVPGDAAVLGRLIHLDLSDIDIARPLFTRELETFLCPQDRGSPHWPALRCHGRGVRAKTGGGARGWVDILERPSSNVRARSPQDPGWLLCKV